MEDYERWVAQAADESSGLGCRQQVFVRVVRLFQDMTYGYCLALLGDRQLAEDAAQDAFITAWVGIGGLREPAAFPGWLKSIVARSCYRWRTRRERYDSQRHLVEHHPARDRDCDPVAALARRESQREVRDAIVRLPEHERVCVVLYYIDDTSYQEIADYLNVPLSTVKKRLFSARRRLRERMKEKMTDRIRETVQDGRPSTSEAFVTAVAFGGAVRSGDVEAAARMLDARPELAQSPSVHALGCGTESPLHHAIGTGGLPMVELLLARGALTEEGDVEAAAQSGHSEIARRLVAAGGIDSTVTSGDTRSTAWFRAIHGGDTATAVDLANAAFEVVEARDLAGRTALAIASAYGALDLVRWLLAQGADVGTTDTAGKTPLQHASDHANWCNKGQPEVIEFLAAHGATYDIFTAARAGVLPLVRALVEKQPELADARNEQEEGPLECAIGGFSSGRDGVVEYLAARNPVMSIWTAAQFGDLDRVRTLLASDTSLAQSPRPSDGFRPLDCAARNWRPQELIVPVIDLLVAHGADVNARPNGSGWAPLHACAEWWNDTQIAAALLSHGADINARSDEGWTPLHYAIALGREEMAQLLRSHGGTE